MATLEKEGMTDDDEVTSGDATSFQAKESLAADRPIGLGDLPPEVRAHIVSMLVSPRHLAAARMASRLFAVSDDMDTVVLRRTSRWGISSILLSRAPLPLIAKVLQASSSIKDPFILVTAASGGRLDVLRLVHAAVEVRSLPLFRTAFQAKQQITYAPCSKQIQFYVVPKIALPCHRLAWLPALWCLFLLLLLLCQFLFAWRGVCVSYVFS